jgi:hypothetical protein
VASVQLKLINPPDFLFLNKENKLYMGSGFLAKSEK